MSGILNGVRVVDLTRYIAGPYCGELLADMGAEVIKIEKPGSGEVTRTAGPWTNGVSLFFQSVNRNKRSVTPLTLGKRMRKRGQDMKKAALFALKSAAGSILVAIPDTSNFEPLVPQGFEACFW